MSERMVIDASVAAKWYLRDALEEDSDLAEDILIAFLSEDLELHAPRIFTYEVCGLLAKACQRKLSGGSAFRLTKDQAVQALHVLFGLPIRYTEASEAEGCQALEMAVDFSKKHYDMTYVRLAEILDCQWCTADRKADEAVPRAFPKERVLHLAELRPAS